MIAGVFLHFSKAVDTINHESSIKMLAAYGFRGLPLKWFSSYLTNGQQYTELGDTESLIQWAVEFTRVAH